MSSFFNLIKKSLTGALGSQGNEQGSNNVIASLFSAARQLKTLLVESNNKVTSLLSLLTSVPGLITDASVGEDPNWVRGKAYPADLSIFGTNATEFITTLKEDIDAWFNHYGNKTMVQSDLNATSTYVQSVTILFSGKPIILGWSSGYTSGQLRCYSTGVATDSIASITTPVLSLGVGLGGFIEVSNDIKGIDGAWYNLCDILKSQVENSDLIQLLLESLDLLLGQSEADTSATIGYISSLVSNKGHVVKSTARSIISSVVEGGVPGGLSYILSFYQSLSTATVKDGDPNNPTAGTITFTDNDNLVPKVYYDGIISTIGTAISVISQAIGMIGSKIIGIVGTVIGMGVQMIGSFLGLDESVTRSRMNYSGKGLTNAAPFALGQYTLPNEYALVAKDVLNLNAGAKAINVPGGVLLFGISSEDPSKVISEFHPDIHSRLHLFNDLFDADEGETVFTLKNISLSDFMEISSHFDDSVSSTKLHNEYTTGKLSASGDSLLTSILCANITIFQLYCLLLNKQHSKHASWYYGSFSIDYVNEETLFTSGLTFNSIDFSDQASAGPRACLARILASGAYEMFLHSGKTGFWHPVRSMETLSQIIKNAETAIDDSSSNTQGGQVKTFGVVTVTTASMLTKSLFYDYSVDWPSIVTFAFDPPKYSASSYWTTMVVAAVVSVAVIAVTVVTAVAVSKMLNKARYKKALDVERAHQTAVNNPTNENIEAYRKACSKNNLFSTIFGGTKYSSAGLWSQPVDSSIENDDGKSSLFSSLSDVVSDDANANPSANTDDQTSLMQIHRSIVG